jgi:hypothetical protein
MEFPSLGMAWLPDGSMLITEKAEFVTKKWTETEVKMSRSL